MNGRRVGWALLALGVLAVPTIPVAGVVGSHRALAFVNLPLVVVYVGIGAVAFWQRRDSRAAQRLLGYGVALSSMFALGSAYSAFVDREGTPTWSGAAVVALTAASYVNGPVTLAMCAVFPDGAYARRYERVLVVLSWALLPLLLAGQLLGQAPLHVNASSVWQHDGDVTGSNPWAVGALRPLGDVAGGLLAISQLWVVVAVVVLVLRYRRSSAETKRQIAWPLYALGLTVVAGAVLGSQSAALNHGPTWVAYLAFYPVLLLLPAGLLVGMLRHRLLDITLVVRRSVVYGVLWLLIAAGYVAVAAVFGVLVGHRMPLDLAIVLTILATVLAAPARRRVERLCNRLVFGERVSGYDLISRLGSRLEASLAPDEVVGEVVRAVQEGVGASWVRVVVGTGEPKQATLHVPLVHGDDVVGALLCGPKWEGEYRPSDETLLATLGRQAALALRTAQLQAELETRLVELAASRARLVEAEEAGRRRIERDLHDGVQQELVALLTRLSMARNQLRRDSLAGATATATVNQAHADARRALESLQELVRGIHPAVLTDRGLLEAVEELVTRLPIPARVEDAGLGRTRLDAASEGAAYFVVSEALGNVLKHAAATHVCLRLGLAGGQLWVEVVDDGRGFVVDGTARRGLRGLADRIDALGGHFSVTSAPDAGTTVAVRLPARVAAHV